MSVSQLETLGYCNRGDLLYVSVKEWRYNKSHFRSLWWR